MCGEILLSGKMNRFDAAATFGPTAPEGRELRPTLFTAIAAVKKHSWERKTVHIAEEAALPSCR